MKNIIYNNNDHVKTPCVNFEECGGHAYKPYKICLLCHRTKKAFSLPNPSQGVSESEGNILGGLTANNGEISQTAPEIAQNEE